MLLFKKVDAFAQIVLIVLALLFGIILRNELIIYSYFIVGGWQVVSALTNLIWFNKMPALKGRKGYLIALLLIAVAGVVSVAISDLIIFFLIGLLIISPFLAIWYAAICFGEIKLWEGHQTPEPIDTM